MEVNVKKDFRTWSKNRGFVLVYTAPHTPQLNEKAERLNRKILEAAWALILDSGVNKNLWGEAVHVADYLLDNSIWNMEKEKTRFVKSTNIWIWGVC